MDRSFFGSALRATLVSWAAIATLGREAHAQLTDLTQTPNAAGAGIHKSLVEEIGAGRGDILTPNSSSYLIERDPFRSIQRGRQLFQRKFTDAQGLGPRFNDGVGDIATNAAHGAGLSDSCASCHGRPAGSAGFGGNVFTRPESRDAPHLFGLGLQEMLGDEITRDLRAIRRRAVVEAAQVGHDVTASLVSKGIGYGVITARPDGSVDAAGVRGVNRDLRVRPFFAQGATISIREFVVGAFQAEMGLEVYDPDLLAAAAGQDVLTPAGMLLSGSTDDIESSRAQSATDDIDADGVVDEVPQSLVDHMEFYLLNYFKPGTGRQTAQTAAGRALLDSVGCTQCHVADLPIARDRRVADVATVYDTLNGNGVINRMFATAAPRFSTVDDGLGEPPLKRPLGGAFLVESIFADFKRHDLGPAFHERNFDGSVTKLFMTEPLWGVGMTAPYGHDGRSPTLEDVILRHGGEAQSSRDQFVALPDADKDALIAFLNCLVLFAPPDTASNLEGVDLAHPNYPLQGHGSINLSVLFNVPSDKE